MAYSWAVLLWKMYVLRKRRWVRSLLELIMPILVFWLLVYLKNLIPQSNSTVTYDNYAESYTDLSYTSTYKIAYTPANIFTNTIMATLNSTLKYSQVVLVSKSTEDEVVEWLRQQYLNETSDSSSTSTTDHSAGVGVIFINAADVTNLQYILRTTTGNLQTQDSTLYGEQSPYSAASSYEISGFTSVQSAIDRAYLTNYKNINVPNNIYVEYLPFASNFSLQLLAALLPFAITFGFNFVMPSLLRGIIEEKTGGTKEMMKIMGLKLWMNWVSWVLFSMAINVPTTLAVSLILTIDSGSGPTVAANFFPLWIILLLFTLTFVIFTFFVSTFFNNGTLAVIVGLIAWYAISFTSNTIFMTSPDQFSLVIHLLTCLWPANPLLWTINTIGNFQKNGIEWTVSELFNDGAGGGRVSVGLAAIMLCVDIVMYSIITWYIDSIKPGPYGRAKPFTFIFKCFCSKKKDYYQETDHITRHDNYEAPPRNNKVGIKIENLRKTFNQGKVVAVDNVDLNIYEGNITALLGHNGAGKTTTMSILTGFFSPTRGQIFVNDKNIFDNMDQFRSSLGFCPQHNLVFTFFTVIEHLIFFGMLKGLSMKKAEEEGMDLLRILRIDDKKNDVVDKLSGGMKRRLCLCISLIGDPKVLMLDEPTSGLDPESRRQVWDVLLGFRGHRTTIITTHFMEEADVLGDRIAIMDHGQVVCYGTTMFLKKLYGTGYHLNISKVEQAPMDAITKVVEQHVTSPVAKLSSASQLTYNIKSDQSTNFPALFSALDNWKTQLGVTAMGLTCTTMEDVFLKVSEEPQPLSDTNGAISDRKPYDGHENVTGCALVLLQIKALILKWAITRWRTKWSALIMMIFPVLLMAYTISRSVAYDTATNQPSLLISLSSFPLIHVAVSSTYANFASIVNSMVTAGKATYDIIPADTSFNDYFGNQVRVSLTQYSREMIAGFNYNSTSIIAGYSQYFTHSYPLVLNMLANILIQLNNSTSTITVYNHPIVVKASEDLCDLSVLAESHVLLFPMITVMLSFAIIIQGMSVISLPLKERVSNAKQLQYMTGLSPCLYWIVTFVCDFILYAVTVALMIITVFIFQQNQVYSSSGYMGTLILVFVLYGFSGLAFAYFFTFLARTPVQSAVAFIIVSTITGASANVFLALLGRFTSDYGVIRFLMSFNPVFSATSAFSYLLSAMYIDGMCLQCGTNCQTQDPLQFLDVGPGVKNPYGINNFLIFLVVDFLLYSLLIMSIEYGGVKKLYFLISKLWIKMNDDILLEDSDVLAEKERVNATQSLRGYSGNLSVLRVKSLGKKYNRSMTAVLGVTFQVDKGECFGLLGVNGAGKSTTFKMLTGEEIPNIGDASVEHYSLLRQKSKFLARIGYCPQFDAINKLLTGREMLQVYALLRGIPPQSREAEVSRWIQTMGLTEFSERACGTYSGGNKRKLSTAMAFIGEPPVVFLDEPTSGVDPVSRRKLWQVVASCQQAGQAVVLTSHSMEECEALCSRLTIMVGGQMKCIGSAQHLKRKFGQGYTIQIKLLSSQDQQSEVDSLKHNMVNNFTGCSIKDEHLSLLHYHVPDPAIRLSELFSKMEQLKGRHQIIEDYVVSDTTLEQVFMSFARSETKSV